MVFLLWVGCAPRPVRLPPVAPPPAPTPAERLQTHLLGTWESPERGGKISEMVFEADGRVVFKGTLAGLKTAFWDLDAEARELGIHFPEAADRQLDIFHLYIGQGVQAFDRPNKRVTYHFDEDIWTLNVAGWNYTKVDQAAVESPPEPEPVLR